MYIIFVLFIQALKLSHPKDFDFEKFSWRLTSWLSQHVLNISEAQTSISSTAQRKQNNKDFPELCVRFRI